MDEVEQGVHVVDGAAHVSGDAVGRAHRVVQGADRPRLVEVDEVEIGQLGPAGRLTRASGMIGRDQQDHRSTSELDPGDGAEMILGGDEGEIERARPGPG